LREISSCKKAKGGNPCLTKLYELDCERSVREENVGPPLNGKLFGRHVEGGKKGFQAKGGFQDSIKEPEGKKRKKIAENNPR